MKRSVVLSVVIGSLILVMSLGRMPISIAKLSRHNNRLVAYNNKSVKSASN
ncbi:hypothetical protein AWA1501_31210 [Lactiplantibacillus pentosus]|nr:hypothetical protein AWA1501_31210 [Lactiplantibacillus pentosus]